MPIYETDKVALLIDGPSLHATAKSLDFDIDFASLLSYFRRQGRLVRALYYTAVLEDDGDISIRPLADWLDYNGFAVVTKPAKVFMDKSGNRKIKASMNIELTVDAIKLAPNVDHFVIFTGNGDFQPLVAMLQDQGKTVDIVSTIVTKPAMVADGLRRQADEFVDLNDLKVSIARDVVGR